MYKYELNIGSISSPVPGSGWVETSPDITSVTLTKELENDQIFARLKLTGNIEFLGSDFTAIDSLREDYPKIDLRVTYTDNEGSSSIIYYGELSLWGEYAENKCLLKCNPKDAYTNIFNSWKEKFNILNTQGNVKCDITPQQYRLTFYETNVSQSSLWYTYSQSFWSGELQLVTDVKVYAREERVYPDHLADYLLQQSQGWAVIESYPNGTKLIARTWQDGGFDTPIDTDFTSYSDLGGSVSTYPMNSQWIYSGYASTVVGRYGPDSQNYVYIKYLKNEIYYGDTPITFDRCREIRETIKYLIGEMDSSILFDSDSWVYLDNNEDLQHLLIVNISDLMLSGGIQTTTIAEYGNISFSTLMKMFREKLKIYWKLEETVSGSKNYYFRLKHRSEINYSLGSIDLTSFGPQSRNFCRDLWKYNTVKKYNRLEREPSVASNLDFLGMDIKVPLLDNVEEETKITDDSFYYDLWHILNVGTEEYPSTSDNEFALISAEVIETDGVNQLTGFNNVGFESFSYSSGTMIANNTTSWAYANSIAHTRVAGYIYKVTMNLTTLSGKNPLFSYVQSMNQNNETIQMGENEFICIPTSSGWAGPDIIKIVADGVSSFTITDMKIERVVYNARVREGALTGDQIANAELSIANLDESHGQYELPAEEVTINGSDIVLTNIQRLKDKEQDINVTLYNPNDINPEELIKTNKGNIEFRSLKIKMDGSMPEITGAFL